LQVYFEISLVNM